LCQSICATLEDYRVIRRSSTGLFRQTGPRGRSCRAGAFVRRRLRPCLASMRMSQAMRSTPALVPTASAPAVFSSSRTSCTCRLVFCDGTRRESPGSLKLGLQYRGTPLTFSRCPTASLLRRRSVESEIRDFVTPPLPWSRRSSRRRDYTGWRRGAGSLVALAAFEARPLKFYERSALCEEFFPLAGLIGDQLISSILPASSQVTSSTFCEGAFRQILSSCGR
jgi:hypothetical protein